MKPGFENFFSKEHSILGIVHWFLLILWLAFAVFLSRQTGSETADLSGGITEWICDILKHIGIMAKPKLLHSALRTCAHIVIYLVLGFLMSRAFRVSFRGNWLIVLSLLLCFAVGLLDEYQKAFIPGRHCHWEDVAVNCIACIPGALLGWLLPYKNSKK